jgi:hypothetical protein
MSSEHDSTGGLLSNAPPAPAPRRSMLSKIVAVAASSAFFGVAWLMAIHPDTTTGALNVSVGEEAEAQANCRRSSGQFHWSCNGPIPNKYCTQIREPSDPNTWNDNYFCSDTFLGTQWSNSGPIHGQACTQIYEYSDPNTWQDNYLCVPPTSRFHYVWSSAGPLAGLRCVQWLEPSDPHTWNDNYLCIIRRQNY